VGKARRVKGCEIGEGEGLDDKEEGHGVGDMGGRVNGWKIRGGSGVEKEGSVKRWEIRVKVGDKG
jgi:hypothetical protein